MTVPRKFWPYDEVTISRDAAFPSRFRISAPWLSFDVDVAPADLDRTLSVAAKIGSENLTPQDVEDVSWFFSSLAKFPFAYLLPLPVLPGTDTHVSVNPLTSVKSPAETLNFLIQNSKLEKPISRFADRALKTGWTWDHDAALEFSRTGSGYDPSSLFSVARRFHLLNDLEANKTAELLDYLKSLKNDPVRFRKSSALVVRQNHYITETCETTLKAALPIAKNAFDEVSEFIQAEAGHDKILQKALVALGETADSVPTLDVTITLMELFRLIAAKNLLGFAMVVDIFERTTYREEDPMTSVLNEGGETVAGRQMDVHREINDMGEHENVALSFLTPMAAVDEAYAKEALLLAELLTLVIHQLSAETLISLRSA
ncbi:MAG: hypothetical protein EOP06_06655 [Proteobacteria bacterium]|nr:MAG: hypothetical protein EOP06_06655 [Pseudomonadota bacterium]